MAGSELASRESFTSAGGESVGDGSRDTTLSLMGIKHKYVGQIEEEEEDRASVATADDRFDPEEDPEDIRGMGCWHSFRFFLKHSYRDVGRRKCHFCLALCSVFIVVLATLVVNTVISKGPVIFVQIAQSETGEIDAWLTAQTYCNE